MPFTLIEGDIARVQADAVVNAANEDLLAGGGVCGAIFPAAGYATMQAACDAIGHCSTGNAVVTPGFGLPAAHVIHAVGPVWRGGGHHEEALLRSAYRQALLRAAELKARSVAFPLISAGIYGYPQEAARAVATEEIRAFLAVHDDMEVMLVLYDRARFAQGLADYPDVQEYVDAVARRAQGASVGAQRSAALWGAEGYPAAGFDTKAPDDGLEARRAAAPLGEARPYGAAPDEAPSDEACNKGDDFPLFEASVMAEEEARGAAWEQIAPCASEPPTRAHRAAAAAGANAAHASQAAAALPAAPASPTAAHDLTWRLAHMDASFASTVLSLIDERGLTDVEVYKRANLSRQVFSKLRRDDGYRPTKQTAVALAIALELDRAQTESLLRRAGYALGHTSKFDIIVEYFIEQGDYDVFELNEMLFAFDQPLLGSL